ncbi:MAG: ABC transporter permease [Proteobacteria bacterium]|jgi:tungstate transport system permease protein|nr:ABC transporter permease [Pseudomonadota bacterium]
MLDSATYAEVAEITGRTLLVSGGALAFAVLLGVPAGATLAVRRAFPGRGLVMALVNTGMGLPPVVVGLLVALALFRGGPLGALEWMYTVQAMIAAQAIIAFPLVMGLTAAGVQQLDPNLALQLRSLGVGGPRLGWILLREARLSVLAAVMAGFGGAISEVGAVMMVGGNIRGETRVLTTAVVQHTRMGDFATAIALGLVLLAFAFAINLAFTHMQQGGRR